MKIRSTVTEPSLLRESRVLHRFAVSWF